MSGIIWDRCINALIERGLFFAVAWAFSCWHVYTSGVLLGWELKLGDVGFVLVQITIVYICIHHFVVYWRAKSKYYSPLSYRDDVYKDVKDARALATWLMLHSRQPNKSADIGGLLHYKQEVKKGLSLSIALPTNISEDSQTTFADILTIASEAAVAESLEARVDAQNKIKPLVLSFLNKTNWVMRK